MQPNIILTKAVQGLSPRGLANFVNAAGRAVGLRGAVTVLVTGSREILSLNARFKGSKHSTDVLSFRAPDFAEGFAGDIAISRDIAARNARLLGHSVADEIRVLALHGILHLAGYDHESDGGEMAIKEQNLRKRLGLPASLIERTSGEQRRHVKAKPRVRPARSRT
jgi:probable rRNA maturation factor